MLSLFRKQRQLYIPPDIARLVAEYSSGEEYLAMRHIVRDIPNDNIGRLYRKQYFDETDVEWLCRHRFARKLKTYNCDIHSAAKKYPMARLIIEMRCHGTLEIPYHQDYSTDPETAYMFFKHNGCVRDRKLEKIISTHPRWAYLYSNKVFGKKGWPEAEWVIMSHREYCYLYTKHVLDFPTCFASKVILDINLDDDISKEYRTFRRDKYCSAFWVPVCCVSCCIYIAMLPVTFFLCLFAAFHVI